MDKNVFISDCNIVSAGDYCKVVINLFDKNNQKDRFSTSLMSKYNAEKYEQQVLDLLRHKNWFDVKFGTLFPQLSLLTDSDNPKEIVGLTTAGGLLLKNEVKILAETQLRIK